MTLLGQSLQLVVRGLLRAYASETAYYVGLLLALAMLALVLTLSVMRHLPSLAPADAPEVHWEIDPDWWP